MAKTLTIKEKILAFLIEKGIKKVEYFERTGIQSSNFKGANLTSAPGSDMLVKILTTYPELSAEWLMTGRGEMLKSNCSKGSDMRTFQDNTYSIIKSKAPEFTPIKQNKNHYTPVETRPRIPFDAAAGSLSMALGSVSESDCEQVPVIPAFPHYDFTIIARGESMEPQYMSGDELACLFIKESSFIQWGRAHVLDTAQGIVVKRIYDHGTSITCKSNNPNYPDFDIPKKDIYRIALVVGYLRIE